MSQNFNLVEISKLAFKHNLGLFRKNLKPNTKLMTVVKSNAYGHGMIEMARLAVEFGSDWLATANLSEAIELRNAKIKNPILVLSYYALDEKDLRFAIKANISLVVYSEEQIKFIDKLAKNLNKKAKIHIKVDTGTSRLGILINQAFDFIKKTSHYKNIEIEGLFSHFAASEENQKFTKYQLAAFKKLIVKLNNAGINIAFKHFACSAAIMSQADSRFDMVRLGIAAYGLWPSTQAIKLARHNFGKKFNLKPVLSLYTKIVQLKEVQKGTCIGYGCTKIVNQKTKLAILPVGYWEGFDRRLSNKAEVIIAGKRCSVLGRVCMNLIIVDVTKLKKIQVGEKVTLIGRDGKVEVTADEWAKHIGTINYEIITRINPLVKRIYV
ncbi:MAG: alanine racemase [Patescibacteria group bacterium]